MRGNKAMAPRLRPPALLSCLLAAIIPAGNALLSSPLKAHALGGAKRHHRAALHSAIQRDDNQGDGKGGNPFDGVGDLFHQLFPNAPDLPSLPDVSELASSLPHSVSDLMSNVPEINIPELLAAAVPPQSKKYTDVRDFDPNLGRDIEEALRLANILDALGGPGTEHVKYTAPSRSVPLVVQDNASAREEQFSMFREANNNVAVPEEKRQDRSKKSREHPREDGVGKGVMFRENNAADWKGVTVNVGDGVRSSTSPRNPDSRKDNDFVDARTTRPSMFQETNLADRAPAPPSATARANDTAGGRDGVGFANAADVKPVSNRATVRRGSNAHTRNASPVAHYASAVRPPPPTVDRREYTTSQVIREDDPSEPSRRDTARAWDAYDNTKYFEGGWSEYESDDAGKRGMLDGRGTYASRDPIFSKENRRIHITDAALELAASLKLDVHDIYLASGKATIEEEDVRDYLDRRYEQLFSTLLEQRVGHPKASMPNRRRTRGAQYRNGRRIEGGNRRRERSDFVAEELEWEALYDSWRRDEDDNRRKEPQFRPLANDAKDRPRRRVSRPQQRQQQNQRQRGAQYRGNKLDRPHFEQRNFGAPTPALPSIASVPISQLVSHPRLERMPQSAESFDIADYRPTSQAEFRQTYHSQPQRDGFQAPNQQSFDPRSPHASPQEQGNATPPAGDPGDEVELSYEDYNAYFAANAPTPSVKSGDDNLGV